MSFILQLQGWSIVGGTWTSMDSGTTASTAHSGVGQAASTAAVLTLTGSVALLRRLPRTTASHNKGTVISLPNAALRDPQHCLKHFKDKN